MRFSSLVAGTALSAIALAACGTGGSGYGASPSAVTTPTSVMAIPTAASATVTSRDTSLGPVLADANGRTLYGLTKDTNGIPTCVDTCANAWPPLIVDGTSVPAGLDAKLFSVVARPDGSHQLKAGKWPLYRFAGDQAAGDVNGQGSAGTFFAVTPAGGLHKNSNIIGSIDADREPPIP
jgi:predicted lipoprotein with Yx(FWY)xxD motif